MRYADARSSQLSPAAAVAARSGARDLQGGHRSLSPSGPLKDATDIVAVLVRRRKRVGTRPTPTAIDRKSPRVRRHSRPAQVTVYLNDARYYHRKDFRSQGRRLVERVAGKASPTGRASAGRRCEEERRACRAGTGAVAAECVIFVGLPASGKTTFYRQRFAATHSTSARTCGRRAPTRTTAAGARAAGRTRRRPVRRRRQHQPDVADRAVIARRASSAPA